MTLLSLFLKTGLPLPNSALACQREDILSSLFLSHRSGFVKNLGVCMSPLLKFGHWLHSLTFRGNFDQIPRNLSLAKRHCLMSLFHDCGQKLILARYFTPTQQYLHCRKELGFRYLHSLHFPSRWPWPPQHLHLNFRSCVVVWISRVSRCYHRAS